MPRNIFQRFTQKFTSIRQQYQEKYGVPRVQIEEKGDHVEICITTKHFTLTNMTLNDAPECHKKIFGVAEIMKTLRLGKTLSLEEVQEERIAIWVKRAEHGYPLIGLKCTLKEDVTLNDGTIVPKGELAGYISLSRCSFDSRPGQVEIGGAATTAIRGNGYAQEILGVIYEFIAYIIEHGYKIHNAELPQEVSITNGLEVGSQIESIKASTLTHNMASIRVMQGLGFIQYAEAVELYGALRNLFELPVAEYTTDLDLNITGASEGNNLEGHTAAYY